MPLVQKNVQVSSSKYYDVVIQNTVGKLFYLPQHLISRSGRQKLVPLLLLWMHRQLHLSLF